MMRRFICWRILNVFWSKIMQVLNDFSLAAKKILDEEYVLALPTETVYGVGIKWDSQLAYERLVKCKNRRPDKPIAVMCGRNFEFEKYFEITPVIKKVMKKFLPGPLTILVKVKDEAPYQTHLGTKVAGIRIPNEKNLLTFLDSLPYALQVTSANISGKPSTKDSNEVYKIFENSNDVKGIVLGKCESGIPTTVVSFVNDIPIIIREGEIKLEDINKVINER